MADRLGNLAQWVSAVCALVVAGIAIWGVFFSPTSQALVSYLQSELAVRNNRIAGLELRERDLQQSVAAARSDLGVLAKQKAELAAQVAGLNSERESMSRRVAELRDNLEFAAVREKIGTELFSKLVSTIPFDLRRQLEEPNGIRPRNVRIWDDYLRFVEQTAESLTQSDRALGRKVAAAFAAQCITLSKIVVSVPALRYDPKGLPAGEYNRDEHPDAIKLRPILAQLEKIRRDILECFKSVTP